MWFLLLLLLLGNRKTGLTHYPEANTRVNIWRDRCDRQSCKFLACIEKNSENSANNLVYRNPTEAWTMVLTPLFKCFFTQVQILQLLYKFIHILCKFLLTLCDFYTKIIWFFHTLCNCTLSVCKYLHLQLCSFYTFSVYNFT